MNAYLLSAIQSAAYGNQFECSTRDEHSSEIIFSSMRHENEVGVHDGGDELLLVSMMNNAGLKSRFPELATEDGLVIRHKHNDLTDCHVPPSSPSTPSFNGRPPFPGVGKGGPLHPL